MFEAELQLNWDDKYGYYRNMSFKEGLKSDESEYKDKNKENLKSQFLKEALKEKKQIFNLFEPDIETNDNQHLILFLNSNLIKSWKSSSSKSRKNIHPAQNIEHLKSKIFAT